MTRQFRSDQRHCMTQSLTSRLWWSPKKDCRPHLPSAMRIAWPFCFVILFFLANVASGQSQSANVAVPKLGVAGPAKSNESSGSSRCVVCHVAEVEGYASSAMAHSLRRAAQEPDGIVNANGSKITMHSSAKGYFQHWQNAGDETDYRIDYVIGSGNHASGYLVDLGGHLFQSPVAYYKNRQSYDLAPGYEHQPDPDFTRPIREECILCHSGTALHVAGTLNEYRSPIFPAEAESITCERCHGPAEEHLADPRAGTIVNPAKLKPAARDSVCEQCHLFGITRVPNPGKQISDFMPGQPAEDVFTTYHNANPAGDFRVISHVEQFALSACARNSAGRLWCGTCHNPHSKPAQPVQFYRSVCLSCHEASFPVSHPAKDSNCLECHMPRRDAKDGGHSAFTDHRIQRRTGAQPDVPSDAGIVAWREPTPELQARNLGIAYIDAGLQRRSSSLIIQGYRALTSVQEQFPNDSEFFTWIGEALLFAKQSAEAKFAFERALELDPNSALAEASAATPYIQEGNAGPAIAHLQRSLNLDPLNLPSAMALIGLYREQGKTKEGAQLSDKIRTAMSEPVPADQAIWRNPTTESQKKTEEVFKNIQVLKGFPSGQLIPAMQFISSSLGVECTFCHVERHFEKDEKKPKQTARDMMRMMFALNEANFENRREITCYSCHRGAPRPIATPSVDGSMQQDGSDADARAQLASDLPTASELLAKYLQALGGPAAIAKITSRFEDGTADFRGQPVGVEIFIQAPDKQTVVRHVAGGDIVNTFDGRAGWSIAPGLPPREMNDADIDAARMGADLQFPLHIHEMFPELRVEYPEKIGGHESHVLLGIREDQPPVKLYFDQQSNLLVRLIRYAESPLGRLPSQIDYADYREMDGVQIPFRVTISEPGSRSTIQIEHVRQNIQIDDTRFARPPSGRVLASPIPAQQLEQSPPQPEQR
jgi:photosynthetic reaction center cytochrome c subunit